MSDETNPPDTLGTKANSSPPSRQTSSRAWRWGLCALAAIVMGWLCIWWFRPSGATLPPGVTGDEYARAAAGWKRRYGRKPGDLDVVSWLAESAIASGDLETAAACFARIPSTHPHYGRPARHQQGQVLQRLNRLCEAEQNLREFIDLESKAANPRNELLIDAMQRLRSLLELELRFEERRVVLHDLFQRGEGELFDVVMYLFPTLLRWNGPVTVQRAEAALAAEPECFEIRRAVGRYRTGQGRLDESRAILDACLHDRPGDLHSFAFVLACEYERGGAAAIAEAVARLSPPSDHDPWLLLELRGYVDNDQQRFADAVDCFERVLREDPTNAGCHQGIAIACQGLHEPERRERELAITAELMRIQVRLARMMLHDHPPAVIREIAEACERLKLDDHARRMARLGLQLYPDAGEFHVLLERLQAADNGGRPAP
jgi:tetratricopeptide (TPR) repeat protein